jgi:hypothetical protein
MFVSAEAPQLIRWPSNTTIEPDGHLSLHCAARGRPLPQIVWHSYSEPLVERPQLRIGDFVSADGSVHSFVNLSRVLPMDGGLYTCSARNAVGMATRSAFVRVRGAPPVIKPISNVTALAGHFFAVQCPFAADGPLTISWFKGKTREHDIERSKGRVGARRIDKPIDTNRPSCLSLLVLSHLFGQSSRRIASVPVRIDLQLETHHHHRLVPAPSSSSSSSAVGFGARRLQLFWLFSAHFRCGCVRLKCSRHTPPTSGAFAGRAQTKRAKHTHTDGKREREKERETHTDIKLRVYSFDCSGMFPKLFFVVISLLIELGQNSLFCRLTSLFCHFRSFLRRRTLKSPKIDQNQN